ncbi:NAD(P)H-hydrate dehydratase, partial [Azospirillum brasilense]|nr:NAD(P)H-hydrate dehydratase [Azospirillum brasilense]
MHDVPMNDPIPVTRDLLRSMALPHPGDGADKDGRGRV